MLFADVWSETLSGQETGLGSADILVTDFRPISGLSTIGSSQSADLAPIVDTLASVDFRLEPLGADRASLAPKVVTGTELLRDFSVLERPVPVLLLTLDKP